MDSLCSDYLKIIYFMLLHSILIDLYKHLCGVIYSVFGNEFITTIPTDGPVDIVVWVIGEITGGTSVVLTISFGFRTLLKNNDITIPHHSHNNNNIYVSTIKNSVSSCVVEKISYYYVLLTIPIGPSYHSSKIYNTKTKTTFRPSKLCHWQNKTSTLHST